VTKFKESTTRQWISMNVKFCSILIGKTSQSCRRARWRHRGRSSASDSHHERARVAVRQLPGARADSRTQIMFYYLLHLIVVITVWPGSDGGTGSRGRGLFRGAGGHGLGARRGIRDWCCRSRYAQDLVPSLLLHSCLHFSKASRYAWQLRYHNTEIITWAHIWSDLGSGWQ